MNERHRIGSGAATALVVTILIAGCGNQAPAPTTLEVRRGASEAAKLEAEARMDATYEREQARKREREPGPEDRGAQESRAPARNAALAAAEAAHAAGLVRCNEKPSDLLTACKERADAELAAARARAGPAT